MRWWGGKTAKIMSKSALCAGGISALEMDETVVVAGYSKQGMEAWDVRTQQSLCTFSNFEHGGVNSLQFDSRKLVTVSPNGKVCLCRLRVPLGLEAYVTVSDEYVALVSLCARA